MASAPHRAGWKLGRRRAAIARSVERAEGREASRRNAGGSLGNRARVRDAHLGRDVLRVQSRVGDLPSERRARVRALSSPGRIRSSAPTSRGRRSGATEERRRALWVTAMLRERRSRSVRPNSSCPVRARSTGSRARRKPSCLSSRCNASTGENSRPLLYPTGLVLTGYLVVLKGR